MGIVPPNILLILADDHGQWSLGCYGNSEVRTPNLDFLAGSGVRFDNAFTPCPVCSPARASLFTGRIPSQHGVHDFLSEDPTFSDHRWLADELFLSQLLQRQDYQTGLVGKWHCTVDGHKPQSGFDYWVSYDVREKGWQNQYEHSGDVDFTRQGQRVTASGYQSQFLTEEAIGFLRQRDPSRPFFLTVSFVDTHFPFAGQPERLASSYRHPGQPHVYIPPNECSHLAPDSKLPNDHHERVAQYYAGVSMIDHQVGTLLDYLEGQGILDNTLVIYTADHGHMLGHHGLYGKGNATRPQNFYEESIRIPMLLRWPMGALPTGSVMQEPVDLCDLFATILGAGGVELSAEEEARINSPGQPLLPLVHGEQEEWRRYQCCEYGNARMITDLRYKLVRRYPPHSGSYGDELFDLINDPREATNVIDDPNYQGIQNALDQRLDSHFDHYKDVTKAGIQVWNLPVHNRFEPWRS